MRWIVEVTSFGQSQSPASSATYCVEATQWQPALQKVRTLRGDISPLSNFSIELLEDGYRAIDAMSRLRYSIRRTSDDTPLNDGPRAHTPLPLPPPPPPPPLPPSPAQSAKRERAGTLMFASEGLAAIREEAKAHEEAVAKASRSAPAGAPAPAPAPSRASTIAFAGPSRNAPAAAPVPSRNAPAPAPAPAPSRASTIAFAGPSRNTPAAAPVPSRSTPAAAPVPSRNAPAAAPPPPKAAPAVPQTPAFEVLSKREDNPSERSPLWYREYVYAVPEGTPEDVALQLILDRYIYVRSSLRAGTSGRLINLAVFDHVFQGRPQRRPLVTLTWKDWKGTEPEVRFPLRESADPEAPTSNESSARSPASPALPSAVASPLAQSVSSIPALSLSPAPHAGSPQATFSSPASSPSSERDTPNQPSSAPGSAGSAGSAGSSSSSRGAGAVPASGPPGSAGSASSSRVRRLAGDELMSALSDACGDLQFLRAPNEGADFILSLTLEKLPSAVGLIAFLDATTRELIVARQAGGPKGARLAKLPLDDTIVQAAMRQGRAVVVPSPTQDARGIGEHWQALGIELTSLACAPVQAGGRTLGMIEIANPLEGGGYTEGDGDALTYVAARFSEFLVAREAAAEPDQSHESAQKPQRR